MGLSFNINKVMELYRKSGKTTTFPNSLRQVLKYAQNSEGINRISDLAYLLGTAKVESDYSLQRWESDFLCGKAGVPYVNKPCQKALDYYQSTNGKLNYYNLGTDNKGLPYFGRGLIQLTGKGNYDFYGKKLGLDLVRNADLALVPKNSFNIAVAYMNNPRGGKFSKSGRKRSTFDLANEGDLSLARLTVGGSGKNTDKVNEYFRLWKSILEKSGAKPNEGSKFGKIVLFSAIVISLSLGSYFLIKKAIK